MNKPEKLLSSDSATTNNEYDLWRKNFISKPEQEYKKLNTWRRFTYILILCFILMLMAFIVASFSFLIDYKNRPEQKLTETCSHTCRVSLVESIPEGLFYPSDVPKYPTTHEIWMDLINSATTSIEIASFYWTLRENEVYPHNSSRKGEEIFQALYKAGTKRNISINIAQSISNKQNPNTDTELLVKEKAATVRSINFPKLLGGGVLHTKFWIIDKNHFYIGSANMDWRSLTQVKELGIVGYNCSCLTKDLAKIFEVYWMLGDENSVIPSSWPAHLQTVYNEYNPMNIHLNNVSYSTYLSSSPPPLSPMGRTNDLGAILEVINNAEKFVYISVMDYFPLMLYTPKKEFWPIIDNAIRKVAIEDNVKIRMLISRWNHSRPSEDYFLQSLTALNGSYRGVDIEIKRFIVPATDDQSKIPFGRVNHNKYMVTDKVAYIGTSNWSGDYFTNTAGVGIIIEEPDSFEIIGNNTNIRLELQKIFERDWNSEYASFLSRSVSERKIVS